MLRTGNRDVSGGLATAPTMNAINFLSMEVRWVGFKYFGGHGFHVATSAGPKAQRLDSSEGTWAPIGNNALVPKQLFFLYTCFVLFFMPCSRCVSCFSFYRRSRKDFAYYSRVVKKIRPAKYLLHVLLIRFYR